MMYPLYMLTGLEDPTMHAECLHQSVLFQACRFDCAGGAGSVGQISTPAGPATVNQAQNIK